MKMKIPISGSGNGYYGHDTSVISYLETVEPETDNPAGENGDFEEYMWMENEEEFDKQVMQQLEEDELTEEMHNQYYAMLDEEIQHQRNQTSAAWRNAVAADDDFLCQQLNSLQVDLAKSSTLNPDAEEFVPSFKNSTPTVSTNPEITNESS